MTVEWNAPISSGWMVGMRRQRQTALPTVQATRKASIAEEILEQLREIVFAGQLLPGTRIDETKLAGEFDVSRASLREALNQLAGEGLLVYSRNRGMFVREYDEKSARDLFAVRLALEPRAARLAAVNATDAEIDALRDLTAQLESAARRTDWPATMRLDAHLHVSMAGASGNAVLARVLMSLRSETHLLVATTGPEIYSSPEVVNEEHEALVGAVARHEADLAERLAEEHLRNAAMVILGKGWDEKTDN